MERKNTLDQLLKVEAEAAGLVSAAQAEADQRLRDNEEKCRTAYDERFRAEMQTREAALKEEEYKTNKQYQQALDDFRREIQDININIESFSALLNKYLAGEG